VRGLLHASERAAPPMLDRAPRVAFLGVGWIGRSRMHALIDSGAALPIALADADPPTRERVAGEVPGAHVRSTLEELLALGPDGVVIATPSALHADQAVQALRAGAAVFCQKPLGRTAAEVRRVLEAARCADRLLAVDLSYRMTRAGQALREVVESGRLGRVYAAELVFHNAYGPDKPWFTSRRQAGGGCLIDLGTHLIDLLLWLTTSNAIHVDAARILRHGVPLTDDGDEVEDFALAQVQTDTGVAARVACSWFLHAGCDCVFECALLGTEAAVRMTNVRGSFYDFEVAVHSGTAREVLVAPPDDWGGRAIIAWGEGLADGQRHGAAAVEELERLAVALDEIYEAARCAR